MSFQESVNDSPATVTPGLGKGTLDTWWFHGQRGGRTQSRHPADACGGTRLWANHGGRGVCEPALEPHRRWEGLWKKGQGFKPDMGNPAVRDYRGAAGTVSHGGNVNPSCNRKSRNGNPPPKAGRARVLSQRHESESRIQAKADLKPPACSSPEGRVSIVRWNPKGMGRSTGL